MDCYRTGSDELARTEMASNKVVNDHFNNCISTLIKDNLMDRLHLIFNIIEKELSVDHKGRTISKSIDGNK